MIGYLGGTHCHQDPCVEVVKSLSLSGCTVREREIHSSAKNVDDDTSGSCSTSYSTSTS